MADTAINLDLYIDMVHSKNEVSSLTILQNHHTQNGQKQHAHNLNEPNEPHHKTDVSTHQRYSCNHAPGALHGVSKRSDLPSMAHVFSM
jgi:hypothetical protein